MSPAPSRRNQLEHIALASAAATMSIAPTFMVAGMAVQIGKSLHLTPAILGLSVSAFFGLTALSSATFGRVVARFGVRNGLVCVMAVNCAVMLAIASSRSSLQIGISLGVAGAANGAVHPAANALLASGVVGRLGLALGVKQSSMPAATLVGGLAVPVFALTLGWRWAFVFGACMSITVLIATLRLVRSTAQPSASAPAIGPPPRHGFLLLALAVGFGAASGSSLGVFLVDGAVSGVGLAPASAGLLAAAAGGFSVAGRVVLGWLADSDIGPRPFPLSTVLLGTGAIGSCVMALGTPTLFVLGAVLAMGVGFAWTGLVHLAVVSASTNNAAKATGTLMTGMASGSFAGPILLGQVAKHWGYSPMWLIMGGMSVVAAILMRRVDLSRPRSI